MFDTRKVLDVAGAQFANDPAAGGALCVIVDGEEVIWEAWGTADRVRDGPYTRDTLQITQSMAKGVTAALLVYLVGRGEIDLEQRVAAYWPEFAAAGKQDVTVAQLLSHQAGLPYLDGGMPLDLIRDRLALAAALAAQKPAWAPGSKFGYHPQTVGNYADVLFERASGRGVCALLAEVCPQVDAEIYCGLPVAQRDRVALTVFPDDAAKGWAPEMQALIDDPTSMLGRILANIPEVGVDMAAYVNGDGIKDVCMPAANMFTNALSLARLYSCLGSGGVWKGRQVFSADAIEAVTAERLRGSEACFGLEMAFGVGFQHPSPSYPFSPNPRAFGHGGSGGSISFADPDAGLALAFIPNRAAQVPWDDRQEAVTRAAYAALG